MTARLQTVLERANARELGDAVDGISPDRTRWRVPLVRSCLGWGLRAATCGGAGAAVARPALHARLRGGKGVGGVKMRVPCSQWKGQYGVRALQQKHPVTERPEGRVPSFPSTLTAADCTVCGTATSSRRRRCFAGCRSSG